MNGFTTVKTKEVTHDQPKTTKAACVWAAHRAELNKMIVSPSALQPSEASQLCAGMGESYCLHSIFKHFNILFIVMSKVVQSDFRSPCGDFSTIVGCICTSCFYGWSISGSAEPTKKKIHKFIKINQTQPNLCFSCKTEAQSHDFVEKAWTLWNFKNYFQPFSAPHHFLCLVLNL